MSGRVGGPALQVVGRVLTRRFMDSRHDFLVAHWDYEPTKASASRCSLYASVNCGRRSANPKGIPARARVARNELPWENVPTRINPNGLQPEFVPSDGGASTPSGLIDLTGPTQGSSFLAAGLADAIPLGLKLRIRSRASRTHSKRFAIFRPAGLARQRLECGSLLPLLPPGSWVVAMSVQKGGRS